MSDSLSVMSSLQTVFIGILTVFFLTWFAKKLSYFLQPCCKSGKKKLDETDKETESRYNANQKAWTENIQRVHSQKAAKYKEDILAPREKMKKEKREKEYRMLFGSLWSGEGNMLGGPSGYGEENNSTATENETAARRRQLPETPQSTLISKPKKKVKKVITLPDEPLEADRDAILVIMRTPLSTILRRRFHKLHTFQNILDFMTKSGFNQRLYCLYYSYPRERLDTERDATLFDMGFGKRVTLNIEDKSEDE